jgi:hypothetical protein
MTTFYEKGIYNELGETIARELKENGCKFEVNLENLTYTFINCPTAVVNKILKIKELKGEVSVLNEFIPPDQWISPEDTKPLLTKAKSKH